MHKRIHQTLIMDAKIDPAHFTPRLEQNIWSFKHIYPSADYHLYSNDDVIDFIKGNFDQDVLEAYCALVPNAYKSDLARYCLLYHYGGVYSDLSYLHMRSMDLADYEKLVVFRDVQGHPTWATSTSVIAARPGLAVFERAINRIVEHHKTRYIGINPLAPTGPFLLGKVLAEVDDWQGTVFGDSKLLSKEADGRANIVKLMPSGAVIAFRNKGGDADISDLIGTKTPSYNVLWKKKKIWKEDGFLTSLKSRFEK